MTGQNDTIPLSRKRQLFLFGGTLALTALSSFLAAAGGDDANIAVLAQSRSGWEAGPKVGHEPLVAMLQDERAQLIAPEDSGNLATEHAYRVLGQATGIFVTGGHTPTYRQLFAVEPIRTVIRDRYQAGIPYAGLSAGALLVQDIYYSVTFKEENEEEYTPLPGLGLLPSTIIEAHFTVAVRQKRLRRILAMCPSCQGLGIDESACVELCDESVVGAIGEHAFRFTPESGEVRELRSRI